MLSRINYGQCKDCGTPFSLTQTARELDVARGLSEPERCPRCRRTNADSIRTRGAAYWAAPEETDDSKRCIGKFGLARMVRLHPVRETLQDHSVSIDLPRRYAADPAAMERAVAAKEIPADDLWVARKFATIEPAAEQLIRNLVDPNGKRISVLVGPTGTGKSTWVPYRILRSAIGEQGRICITQPRRITLRQAENAPDDSTTPGFIARHLLRSVLPDGSLGIGSGHEVGYQYSGEYDHQDRYTKLLFVTDGTLVHWLETGRVGQFDVVFIDEAHEQSTNMELIFALLKYRMGLFPRLRVVIASATADVEKFRNYFGNGDPNSVFLAAPNEQVNTTPFEIHDRWLEEWSGQAPDAASLSGLDVDARKRLLPTAVAATVRAICRTPNFTKLRNPQGDILVFVPTVSTLETVEKALSDLATRENIPLQVLISHAQMSTRELREFKKSEERAEKAARAGEATSPQRVIIATNYAETSVTISNLRFVIDSGMILQPEWDAATGSNRFESAWHSQAGCKQRKGRVGRISTGECFRLYTQQEHAAFPSHTPPEISRQPLDQFLLSAKAAGIENLQSFQWLSRDDSPSPDGSALRSEFERSTRALGRRGTMDSEGDITRRGLEFGGMRVPRVELAECLASADFFACALEVATFLSFISQSRSPFERSEAGALSYARWRTGCADDLELYLRIHEQWRSQPSHRRSDWAATERLNGDALDAIAKSRQQLLAEFTRRTHDDPTDRDLDLKRFHRVRLILSKSLLEWVYIPSVTTGQFEPFDKNVCPCSQPVEIDQESACYGRDINSFVCVERVLTRGKRLFARHIVCVNREWLPHLQSKSPPALALMLNRTLEEERARVNSTSEIIHRKATVDVSGYSIGQLCSRLRVIRSVDRQARNGGGWLLSEDVQTGQPVLVEKATADVLESGAELRAFISEIDAHPPGRLIANQDSLMEWYRQNAGKKHNPLPAQLTSLRVNESTGEVALAIVRIEPGIGGVLEGRDMDFTFRKLLPTMPIGSRLDANVKEVRNGRELLFILPQVAKAREYLLKQGEQFPHAIVEGFDIKDGRRVGAFVEILPGRTCYLPVRLMGSSQYRQPIQQTMIDDLAIGATIPVSVDAVRDERKADLRLICRQADSIRSGERIHGYVQGFLNNGARGPEAIFVELVPGTNGMLHFSKFRYLSRGIPSQIGKPLDVVVHSITANGRKKQFELDIS